KLSALRLRQQLLPERQRHQPHRRAAAGIDLARPLDHAPQLSHLDPARHPQGGARRITLDIWTSGAIIVGYAVPSFLFAILLIVLFSGGSYLQWFPLRGLVSDDWSSFGWPHRILDYFWHLALPVTAMIICAFANLTMLTKNSFLDEINKQYVVTARAKGLGERRVLYGHVF